MWFSSRIQHTPPPSNDRKMAPVLAYSNYSDKINGVPQGSILGLPLFNIYVSDMFYNIDKRNVASYAEKTTLYISDFNLEEVIQKLELIHNNLLECFKHNHMKANAGKCHLVVTGDTDETAKIGEFDE